jgi:heme-degrading monooxygenase HmoA
MTTRKDNVILGMSLGNICVCDLSMYARIARIGLKPGTEDRAMRALEVQGIAAFESVDGFISLTVYLDRDAHIGYLITHWDTHEHALAVGSAQPVRDLLERIQGIVAIPAAIDICEVAYNA